MFVQSFAFELEEIRAEKAAALASQVIVPNGPLTPLKLDSTLVLHHNVSHSPTLYGLLCCCAVPVAAAATQSSSVLPSALPSSAPAASSSALTHYRPRGTSIADGDGAGGVEEVLSDDDDAVTSCILADEDAAMRKQAWDEKHRDYLKEKVRRPVKRDLKA